MAEFTTNYSFTKPDFNVSPWHDDVNGNFDLLDSLIFAFSGIGNVKGEWTNDTIYTQGDRVIDGTDGSLWQCLVSHTSVSAPDTFADDRLANPTFWNAINVAVDFVGQWQTGVNYSVNEFLFDGHRYGVVVNNYTSGASYNADVTNGDIVTLIDLTASVNAASVAVKGFRNLIINGDFDIWQRATSLSASIGNRFAADRWIHSAAADGSIAANRIAHTLGSEIAGEPRYFCRSTVVGGSTASANAVIVQRIENVRNLAGKTATITFWAKSPTGSVDIAVELAQAFGTGGSPSTTVFSIGVTTVSLTTSWQKFSYTVNLPSIVGKTIGTDSNDYINVAFWLSAGSNFDARTNSLGNQSCTIDLARVSVVEGDATAVADPFVERSIAEELELCQRYYEKSYDMGNFPGDSQTSVLAVARIASATTLNSTYFPFKTRKRGSSTIHTYISGSAVQDQVTLTATGNGVTTETPNALVGLETGFQLAVNTGSGMTPDTPAFLQFHWTAEAEL